MKLKPALQLLLTSSILLSTSANSTITASFITPDGIVSPSESIPVWVTLSSDSDFFFDNSDPDGDKSFGNLNSANYPTRGFDFLSRTFIDIEEYESATTTTVSFGCSGSFFITGSCLDGGEYDFNFNHSTNSPFSGKNSFTLNTGESQDFLFGTFIPRDGLTPKGTYNFYSANFAINLKGYGFNEDNERVDLNVHFNLASSCTTGDNSCDFSRTVVPLPTAIWFFGSAILGLAGLRRHKNS